MIYPLSAPDSVSPAAIEAGIASLRTGRYTMGPAVAQFEDAFAAYVGARHAVMVNSGSSANLLAVEALLRPSNGTPLWLPGDEVLVPALAWSTTVWPLVQLGLVPVFVDSDPETLGMSAAHAAELISDKTVGMVVIHVLGCPADLEGLTAVCRAHELLLVEDCCESVGAQYRRRSVGTYGLMGTYSHYFAHQLTTIEGGTIVTDDSGLADDLCSLRAHGWIRNRTDQARWATGALDPRFLFVTTGYNVRPLELQGAIGVVQLAQLAGQLAQRRATVAALRAVLATVPGLAVPGLETDRRHTWMNLPLLVHDAAPFTRDEAMRQFEAAGVETRPLLAGNLLRHPAMAGLHVRVDPAGYPVADRVMRQGFMIGCHGPARPAVEAVTRACQRLARAA